MTPAIRCVDLHKTYPGKPPVEAVRGLNLEVQQGECFGLLGPNGAGKTTSMEIIEGLLPATRGELEVLGKRWGTDDHEIRQRMGISLQETKLSEKLSVIETITLFRSFYRRGIDPQEAMRQVELEPKEKARIKSLSGGQKQRLAVACALVGDPDLLCLDEPTTGLDPQSRRQLWEIISALRHRGKTILLTTHYMEEAERLCDCVAIVDQGKVIALGSPNQLIAGLGGEHIIEFSLEGEPFDPAHLSNLPTVTHVGTDHGQFNLSVGEPHKALPALLARLAESQRNLSKLAIRHASLDDVFVKLAGRHLEETSEGTPKS
jgi:ABC-2 type transport system ATP-binding protein